MKSKQGKKRSSDHVDEDQEEDSGEESQTSFLTKISRKMAGKHTKKHKKSHGSKSSRKRKKKKKKRASYQITEEDSKALAAATGEVKIHVKDEENVKPEEIAVAPDGGWGWVVVFGSFISNFIVEGLVLSIGIFLVPIKNSFEEETGVKHTDSTMGWILSLLNGFYALGGPLAAAVANKFGFRVTATIGALVASFGFSLTYLFCLFEPNLIALFVCLGVVGGLGSSFLYVASVISVGFYFEKHRALSTGICVTGAGVGQMVFGYVFFYMVDTYGWRVSLIIQAGMFLLCVFPASLYRPLEPQQPAESEESNAKGEANEPAVSSSTTVHKQLPQYGQQDSVWKSHVGHTMVTVNEKTGKREIYNETDMKTINSPLYRDDIFLKGTMKRIPVYAEVEKGAFTKAEWSVMNTSDRVTPEEGEKGRCKSLRLLLGGSILASPTFIVLLFSSSLIGLGLFTPFAFLPDIAAGKKLEEWVPTLFIVMGAANTVGRASCGIMADFPKAKAEILLAISLCISGGACCALPFLFTIELYIAYVIVFGFFIAFFFSLLSVVIADLMGLDNLTNAFGMMGLFLGIFTIVGTPFAGYLVEISVENWKVDEQHNFDLSFYVAGALLALSGVMLFPLRLIKNCEKKRKDMKEEKEKEEDFEVF